MCERLKEHAEHRAEEGRRVAAAAAIPGVYQREPPRVVCALTDLSATSPGGVDREDNALHQGEHHADDHQQAGRTGAD